MIKRRQFKRHSNTRSYRRIFYILSEGEETEPLYFGMLKKHCTNINIEIYSSGKKTSAKKFYRKLKN